MFTCTFLPKWCQVLIKSDLLFFLAFCLLYSFQGAMLQPQSLFEWRHVRCGRDVQQYSALHPRHRMSLRERLRRQSLRMWVDNIVFVKHMWVMLTLLKGRYRFRLLHHSLIADKDACISYPCAHEGVCSRNGHSFKCKCQPGNHGSTCEGADLYLNLLLYCVISNFASCRKG